MDFKKLTSVISPKKNRLQEMIKKAVEDGEVTDAEREQITALADELKVSQNDLEIMIKDAFREAFKKTVVLYAQDGKVDKKEMESLQMRALQAGISAADMNVMVNEALSNQKAETREKMKKIIVKAGKVAAEVAVVGVGAYYLITKAKSKGPGETHIHVQNKHYH